MQDKLPPGQFYGRVVESLEVAEVILSETNYHKGFQIPRHSHEHAYFSIVLRGGYCQTYGSKSRICKPLTVAYHPAGELHSAQFPGSSVRSFNIELRPVWVDRMRQCSLVLEQSVDFQGGPLAGLAMRLHKEYRHGDNLSPLAIEALALEMMVQASRESDRAFHLRPPRWLTQARDVLHDRFCEAISLSDLAKDVGVHPVYLATQFRKHYRYTIGEYQRKLRIDFACSRLAASDLPLVDIAIAAGFSHQGHFSTVFKRVVGMTPTEYRSTLRTSGRGD